LPDKVAVGMLKLLAPGKVRSETSKDAASELERLARRVSLRAAGKPVDDQAGRQMLEICEFGAGTMDPDVVPLFDDGGQLVLEPEERVLWQGMASVAAEEAEGAGGKEQYKPLWRAAEPASVTLTTERLVYDIRRFVRGDGSWMIVGGVTGAMLTVASFQRARGKREGRTAAGQLRHINVANLVTGAGSRPTYSSATTITATLFQLPTRILRVSLDVAGDSDAALARTWAAAVAADHIRRFGDLANDRPDEWATLQAQQTQPSFIEGFHGQYWALPLWCPVTRSRPLFPKA
jgi:hypothetical protein